MKIVTNNKSFVLVSLWTMVGINAAWAAGTVDDGQQQARSLLGGRDFRAPHLASRAAIAHSAPSSASTADAQEQGRQMILGRVNDNSIAVVTANATYTKTVRGSRNTGEGGNGMARRMILRNAS